MEEVGFKWEQKNLLVKDGGAGMINLVAEVVGWVSLETVGEQSK